MCDEIEIDCSGRIEKWFYIYEDERLNCNPQAFIDFCDELLHIDRLVINVPVHDNEVGKKVDTDLYGFEALDWIIFQVGDDPYNFNTTIPNRIDTVLKELELEDSDVLRKILYESNFYLNYEVGHNKLIWNEKLKKYESESIFGKNCEYEMKLSYIHRLRECLYDPRYLLIKHNRNRKKSARK